MDIMDEKWIIIYLKYYAYIVSHVMNRKTGSFIQNYTAILVEKTILKPPIGRNGCCCNEDI